MTTGQDSGGCASASTAPASAAAAIARAPPSARTREAGSIMPSAIPPLPTRSAVARPPDAHAQALDLARVGVEHLELVALRMHHDLAARRHAAGDPDDEAAERVDLLGEFGVDQPDVRLRLEILDIHPRLRQIDAVALVGPQRAFVLVVLVADVADDLLDQILDRHEPVDAAVFVDDQRHVEPRRLHLLEQHADRHRRRHVQQRPQQPARSKSPPAAPKP